MMNLVRFLNHPYNLGLVSQLVVLTPTIVLKDIMVQYYLDKQVNSWSSFLVVLPTNKFIYLLRVALVPLLQLFLICWSLLLYPRCVDCA
jgi:hypothetical protein